MTGDPHDHRPGPAAQPPERPRHQGGTAPKENTMTDTITSQLPAIRGQLDRIAELTEIERVEVLVWLAMGGEDYARVLSEALDGIDAGEDGPRLSDAGYVRGALTKMVLEG
jgi:hypothetical protein